MPIIAIINAPCLIPKSLPKTPGQTRNSMLLAPQHDAMRGGHPLHPNLSLIIEMEKFFNHFPSQTPHFIEYQAQRCPIFGKVVPAAIGDNDLARPTIPIIRGLWKGNRGLHRPYELGITNYQNGYNMVSSQASLKLARYRNRWISPGLFITVWLACLALARASDAPAFDPSLPAKSRCVVAIDAVRPTQFAVGYREVEERAQKIVGKSPKKFQEYMEEHLPLLVVGPGGVPYLIDGHHLAMALLKKPRDRPLRGPHRGQLAQLEPRRLLEEHGEARLGLPLRQQGAWPVGPRSAAAESHRVDRRSLPGPGLGGPQARRIPQDQCVVRRIQMGQPTSAAGSRLGRRPAISSAPSRPRSRSAIRPRPRTCPATIPIPDSPFTNGRSGKDRPTPRAGPGKGLATIGPRANCPASARLRPPASRNATTAASRADPHIGQQPRQGHRGAAVRPPQVELLVNLRRVSPARC